MRISVVIPTFNRKSTLYQTLLALMAQDHQSGETIVVDDGSDDGTREMILRQFPSTIYLFQRNRGPAAARNQGIRMARGDVVAFTDDDCLPPRDWLSRLVDGYTRYPQIAGVGGYLEAAAGLLATNIFARYEQYVAQRVYRAGDRECVGGFECPAGGANNMSYRREILELAAGFDESFPYAAGEDADLKWRICQLGYRLLYVPCRVIHLQDYAWRNFRAQQIRHGRGAVYFERKHKRLPSRLRLALRFAKRWVLFFREIFRIGPALAWIQLWAGWFDCWGQWLEVARLRRAS